MAIRQAIGSANEPLFLGETWPPLRGLIEDGNGQPINISGGSIRFVLATSARGTVVMQKVGTISDQVSAAGEYQIPALTDAETSQITAPPGGMLTFFVELQLDTQKKIATHGPIYVSPLPEGF